MSREEQIRQVIENLPAVQGKSKKEAIEMLRSGAARSSFSADRALELWQEWGLCFEDEEEIVLLRPAEQLISSPDRFSIDAVRFLGGVVDDLLARRALLDAGQVLVDNLAGDILFVGPVTYLPESVLPDQFAGMADKLLSLRFYGAAVSLMINLSNGEPAASYAEEICAVALIELAKELLEMSYENDEISKEELEEALPEPAGIFALFQDADVLGMFEAEESPFTSASERKKAINALFEPLWGNPVTGYLGARG